MRLSPGMAILDVVCMSLSPFLHCSLGCYVVMLMHVCVLYFFFVQSMVDVCADEGWLCTTLRVMHLVQMCVQGRWLSDPSILILPYLTTSRLNSLKEVMEKSSLGRSHIVDGFVTLPELIILYQRDEQLLASALLKVVQSESQTKEVSNSNKFYLENDIVIALMTIFMDSIVQLIDQSSDFQQT